jgi:hypothetical protein
MDSLFPGNHRCVAGTGALQALVLLICFYLVVLRVGTSSSIRRCISVRFYQEVLDDASVSIFRKAAGVFVQCQIFRNRRLYLFVSKADAGEKVIFTGSYDFNRGGQVKAGMQVRKVLCGWALRCWSLVPGNRCDIVSERSGASS